MLKLFKLLKKYKHIIPIIVLLISMQAIATLMLPDYMSKMISEGIKSPAYETTEANGKGDQIVSIIDPSMLIAGGMSGGDNALLSVFAVKKYARTGSGSLVADQNGFAMLAGADGSPIIGGKGKVAYEKDSSGNYILDAQTGSKILKYVRTEESVIVTDEKGEATAVGFEQNQNGQNIIGPYVTPILIYNYTQQPSALLPDEYNQATFAGFYFKDDIASAENIINVKLGITHIPAMKFLRADGNFGVLTLDKEGFAQLKQVSYIPVILKYGLIMIGITCLISAAAITANYFAGLVSMRMGRDIRSKLYNKINDFSVFEMSKFGAATLITRTTNDVVNVQNLTTMIFRMVIMTPIMFIGGLIMALRKNADMTMVLLFSIPVIIVIILIAGLTVAPLFKKMQVKIDNLTSVSRENLTGIRVIRAFGQEETEQKRFEKANVEVTQVAIKANRIMAVMMPAMMLIMSLTSLAIIFIAVNIAKSDIAGTSYKDFANMMAVTQYIMQIMMSVLMVMMMFVMFPKASASASRINEVLETQTEIHNPANPVTAENNKGLVEFKDVSFKFSGSENCVLKNISFTCNPNQVTAIIGSTGSGKSSVINLIPRLFDATQGQVLIDGIDVKDYDIVKLRNLIGFIPQKSLLFSGTIADNMRFANQDATDEEIYKALEIAQAKDFVDKLPEGIYSEVEQGGVNFSGGQKQRLCIARAITRKAKIFIFDDTFSALDFKTDADLRAAIKKELKDSTQIIVAQRIGTIINADNILVLDEGNLVGAGTHDYLLKNCKVYKEIALSQLSEEELKI